VTAGERFLSDLVDGGNGRNDYEKVMRIEKVNVDDVDGL
jgi:hypothetical protein